MIRDQNVEFIDDEDVGVTGRRLRLTFTSPATNRDFSPHCAIVPPTDGCSFCFFFFPLLLRLPLRASRLTATTVIN